MKKFFAPILSTAIVLFAEAQQPISYRKSVFFKENYPELHEFYKKMHEMLIEPIVLKKA